MLFDELAIGWYRSVVVVDQREQVCSRVVVERVCRGSRWIRTRITWRWIHVCTV